MAFLEFQTNMTGWWEAAHLVGSAHGDEVLTWTSQAAGAFTFNGAAGTAPKFVDDGTGPNGLPYLSFPAGESRRFSGNVRWGDIIDAAKGSIIVVARPTAINGNSETITDNDALMHGAITNTPGLFLRNNGGVYTFYPRTYDGAGKYATFSIPTAEALHWAIYVWRLTTTGANSLYGHRNDGYVGSTAAACGNTTNLAQAVRVGMNGAGTTFFTGDIAAILTYDHDVTTAVLATGVLGKILAYLMARYFSPNDADLDSPLIRGDAFEQVRDTCSRRLLEREQRQQVIEWTGARKLLDYQIGDDLDLVHKSGPDPLGAGGGWPVDAPKRHRVIGLREDSPGRVTLILRPL